MTTAAFQITDSREDRITAAIAHVGVIVPYAGMLVPLLVWLTQGKKSALIQFQSLQALLYLLFLTLLPIVVWPIIMVMVFVTTPAMALFDNSASSGAPTGINYVIMVALLFLPFIVALLFLAFMLSLVVFGLVGAATVVMGRSFRYPLLSTIADRLISRK